MVGPALLFWAVATAALAVDPAITNPDQETIIGQLIRQQMHMSGIIIEDLKMMTMDIQSISDKISNLEKEMVEGSMKVDIQRMSEKISNLEKEMVEGSMKVDIQSMSEKISSLENKMAEGSNEVKEVKVILEEIAEGTEHVKSAIPKDCSEVAVSSNHGSGVYTMRGGVKMYCDIEGGEGWTVIQRRYNSGPQSFDKNWNDYKNGFGDLNGEFWLGNEKIHALTSRKPHMIQFVLGDCGDHGDMLVADYRTFSVGNESSGYRLTIGDYSGNATDGMSGCARAGGKHNGMRFSTRDKDNDKADSNCAVSHGATGWWYNSCYCSRLNSNEHANWNYDKKVSCNTSKMRIKPLQN